MGKRALRSNDVEGFLLAVWDEWVDQERVFGETVTVRVYRGDRRGTFRFHAAAYQASPEGGRWAVAEAEVLWPTNKATSLHAVFYSLLCRHWASLSKAYNHRLPDQDSPATD